MEILLAPEEAAARISVSPQEYPGMAQKMDFHGKEERLLTIKLTMRLTKGKG